MENRDDYDDSGKLRSWQPPRPKESHAEKCPSCGGNGGDTLCAYPGEPVTKAETQYGGDGDHRMVIVPVNMIMPMRKAFLAAMEDAKRDCNGPHVSADRAWWAAINALYMQSGAEGIEMGSIERELTALRNSTSWAIDRRRIDEALAELATLRDDIARLRRYADAMNGKAGTERHVFNGLCPDNNQPDSLDPECPACQLLMPPNDQLHRTGADAPGPSGSDC